MFLNQRATVHLEIPSISCLSSPKALRELSNNQESSNTQQQPANGCFNVQKAHQQTCNKGWERPGPEIQQNFKNFEKSQGRGQNQDGKPQGTDLCTALPPSYQHEPSLCGTWGLHGAPAEHHASPLRSSFSLVLLFYSLFFFSPGTPTYAPGMLWSEISQMMNAYQRCAKSVHRFKEAFFGIIPQRRGANTQFKKLSVGVPWSHLWLTELSRLEKTYKVIKNNQQSDLQCPITKLWPSEPRQHIS